MALNGKRDDRHVGIREHLTQRQPRTVIQSTRAVLINGQSRCFDGLHYCTGAFAASGSGITQGVKLFRKSPEIVNRLQAVSKPDGRPRSIPMRTDNDDRSRLRQQVRGSRQRCSSRTGAQGEGWRTVRNKKRGLLLGLVHDDYSRIDERTVVQQLILK